MSQRYIGGLIYNPPGGFSGYFDGTGDSLTVPDSTAFTMGSGDFSVEFWYFPTSSARQLMVAQTNAAGNTVAFWVEKNSSNQLRFVVTVGGTQYVGTASETMAVNSWSFIQVVRSGTTVFGYQNGSQVCSASVGSGSLLDSTDVVEIGGVSVGLPVTGYISNVRILKGTASSPTIPSGPLQAITNTSLLTCAYGTFRDGSSNNFTITVNGNTAVSTQNPFPQTQLPNPALGNQGNGVYSMSQYQALRSQNLWPAIDPYFDYVTLMLHGNGTNGAQNNTFLDSSTNNFTITRNGNTTQGTFSPYGSNWSNYFDGTGDYLSVADNAAFEFGSGNFTIEGWINPNALGAGLASIVTKSDGTGGAYAPYLIGRNGSSIIVRMSSTGSSWDIVNGTSFGTLVVGQWMHFALVRNGTAITAYLNGVGTSIATTSASLWDNSNSLLVGAIFASGSIIEFFNGYISNVRLVKGTAVYTSNFTPPVNPLTVISGTSLLTCADNRFIDDSTNNFTITRNGDVSVQRFSPFNPTTPYAAGTIGGSGYFDGTNDYLSLASNAAFNYGTGDFRFDFWIYPTGGSGPILEQRVNPSTAPYVGYDATNQRIEYYINSGGTLLTATPNGSVQPNQWSFITVSRVSNTSRIFVNGVERSSAADNNNYGTTYLLIGASISGGGISSSTFPGYMGDYRVVKGSGVSSGFSVPTSPLTAITNTSLLCNFTNAAIIDNAMMNDLETVGNAQISTSVSKFGGGSLAFDGTGDWLNMLTTPNITFGSGDFTFEGWLYLNSVTGAQIIFDQRPASTQGVYPVLYMNAAVMTWYISTTATITSSSLSTGVWYHFAVCRSSGSTRMFINGVQNGSTYADTNNYLASRSYIGISAFDQTGGLNGYIDDLRLTKGYARYTANFTPQRSQWQDQ